MVKSDKGTIEVEGRKEEIIAELAQLLSKFHNAVSEAESVRQADFAILVTFFEAISDTRERSVAKEQVKNTNEAKRDLDDFICGMSGGSAKSESDLIGRILRDIAGELND